MFVYGCTFWILFTQFTDTIKLVECKSIIRTKKFLVEDAEDSLVMFILTPGRQLLDSRGYDFEPTPHSKYTSRESSSDTAAVLYVVIAFIIFILYFLVRCCMNLAKEGDDELNTGSNSQQRILHLPPGRLNNRGLVPQRRPARSRPLAPPRTSPSSLILLPEERHLQTLFENIENPAIGGIENPAFVSIENPTYNISTFDRQIRRDINPTPLLDLPPDYATVIKEKSVEGVDVTKEKDLLPKYDNI